MPTRIFLVAVLTLALSACTPPADQTPEPQTATPTQIAEPKTTPSVVVENTPQPTVPVVLSPSPLRNFLPTALPPSDTSQFDLGTFIFEEIVSGCALPCWRGLIIDSSTLDDVKYVFDASFGNNGIDNIGLASFKLDHPINDPAHFGYIWVLHDGSNHGRFSVRAGVDPISHIIGLLSFQWETMNSLAFEVNLTPQQVIKKLGSPRQILASGERFGTASSVWIHIILIP